LGKTDDSSIPPRKIRLWVDMNVKISKNVGGSPVEIEKETKESALMLNETKNKKQTGNIFIAVPTVSLFYEYQSYV
jgi:hypothetical protein